jgi:hypothetical protein
MKRPARPIDLVQLHLPLLTASKVGIVEISQDKQKELAVVFVKLLISAAQESNESKTSGGEDEPKAHR